MKWVLLLSVLANIIQALVMVHARHTQGWSFQIPHNPVPPKKQKVWGDRVWGELFFTTKI